LKYKNYFKKVTVIRSAINTGISENCNRGISVAQGSWIKVIAGDDILVPRCLEINILHALNSNSCIFTSYSEEILMDFNEIVKRWNWMVPEEFRRLKSAEEQFDYFLSGNGYLSAPTIFFKNGILGEGVKVYDSINKYIEDIPFYLRVTGVGIKISVIKEITVIHRRHVGSLTSYEDKVLPKYMLGLWQVILLSGIKTKKYVFIVNAIWNLGLIKLILFFGNKSVLLYPMNKFRVLMTPLRFIRMLNRIKNVYKNI